MLGSAKNPLEVNVVNFKRVSVGLNFLHPHFATTQLLV